MSVRSQRDFSFFLILALSTLVTNENSKKNILSNFFDANAICINLAELKSLNLPPSQSVPLALRRNQLRDSTVSDYFEV